MMKRMIFLVAGIILVLIACALLYAMAFKRPNASLRQATATVGSSTFNVEIASTTLERTRGLSYRESLGADQGLLFIFDAPAIQNFWMKDMNFPIDIIWIGGGKVLGFAENAQPQPGAPLWKLKIFSSPDGTDRVLEVNAGTVANDGIKEGDAVAVSGA